MRHQILNTLCHDQPIASTMPRLDRSCSILSQPLSERAHFFARAHNPYPILFAYLHFFGTRPALICTLLHGFGANRTTGAWSAGLKPP